MRGVNDAAFHSFFVRNSLTAVPPGPMLMRVRLAAGSSPRKCLRCPPALSRMTRRDQECLPGSVSAKRAAIGRICGVSFHYQSVLDPKRSERRAVRTIGGATDARCAPQTFIVRRNSATGPAARARAESSSRRLREDSCRYYVISFHALGFGLRQL